MAKLVFGKEAEGSIDSADHADFEKVFQAYKKIFTLESEFKPRRMLLQALARNTDTAIQRKIGPCKEMWVYLKTPEGEIAGASNFDVFAGSPARDIDGTLHGIFTFVNPKFRGQGILPKLFRMREEHAQAFIREVNPRAPAKPSLLSFIEQNSPPLMTSGEWDEDMRASGTNPVVRRHIFELQGYRQLNMRYIQPPLTRDGEPCNFLDLCVGGNKGSSIPANVVRQHLQRFFALSFPEGVSLDHPSAKVMKDDLDRQGESVGLLPPGRFQRFVDLAGMSAPSTQLGATVQLPQTRRDSPLGDVFAAASGRFYGPGLTKLRDILPKAAKYALQEPDVLIIGAGIAGLRAAHRLRKEGVSYRIIEAAGETGGRAKTVFTESGMPIDTGAHWGHNSKENPLTRLLDRSAIPYTVDPVQSIYSYRDGINHAAALRKEADAAINPQKAKRILSGTEPDCALAELIDDPDKRRNFCRKYSTWYGLDKDMHPSALEYLSDEGTPGGFQIKDGVKSMIDVMSAKVRLEKNGFFNMPVTRISSLPEGVKVETASGEIFTAKKAIVTLPHAVLISGNVEFDPPLSERLQSDLGKIAVGKMTKMVLELKPGFLKSRGIPHDTHLDLTDSEPSLFCHLHGAGKPSITMLAGGGKAEEVEKFSSRQAMDYLHAHLAQVDELEGYREHSVGTPFISNHNGNPYALGAYSVCMPGAKRTGPRHEGNLYFAGDAFDTRFPASMAGAYNSGNEAALLAAKALRKEKRIMPKDMRSSMPFTDRLNRSEREGRTLN